MQKLKYKMKKKLENGNEGMERKEISRLIIELKNDNIGQISNLNYLIFTNAKKIKNWEKSFEQDYLVMNSVKLHWKQRKKAS